MSTLKDYKPTPTQLLDSTTPRAAESSPPREPSVGSVQGTQHSMSNRPPSTGGTGSHPFKLVSSGEGWAVSSTGSTITDGTDGTSIAITGLGTEQSGDGLVAIKVSLDSNLDVTGAEVDVGTFSVEVNDDGGTPPTQIEAWLLVGRVTLTDGVYSFTQAIQEAQLLSHGLLNGMPFRGFMAAPVHTDAL